MSMALPEKDFAWCNQSKQKIVDVINIPDDSDIGYILEVDLECPPSLHDNHGDYPLALENKTITNDMLSSHSLMLKNKLGNKGST